MLHPHTCSFHACCPAVLVKVKSLFCFHTASLTSLRKWGRRTRSERSGRPSTCGRRSRRSPSRSEMKLHVDFLSERVFLFLSACHVGVFTSNNIKQNNLFSQRFNLQLPRPFIMSHSIKQPSLSSQSELFLSELRTPAARCSQCFLVSSCYPGGAVLRDQERGEGG